MSLKAWKPDLLPGGGRDINTPKEGRLPTASDSATGAAGRPLAPSATRIYCLPPAM